MPAFLFEDEIRRRQNEAQIFKSLGQRILDKQRRERDAGRLRVLGQRIIDQHRRARELVGPQPTPEEEPTYTLFDPVALSREREEREEDARAAARARAITFTDPRTGKERSIVPPFDPREKTEEEINEWLNSHLQAQAKRTAPWSLPGAAYMAGTESVIPERVTAPIGRIPVVGPKAEEFIRTTTGPLTLPLTAAFPGITARMGVYGIGGWAAGKGLEEAGVPTVEVGPITVGPAGVLETAGFIGGPAFGPMAERAAVSGVRQLPTVAQAGVRSVTPSVGRLLTEETGGLRLPPPTRPKPPPPAVVSKEEAERGLKILVSKHVGKATGTETYDDIVRLSKLGEPERFAAVRRLPPEVRQYATNVLRRSESELADFAALFTQAGAPAGAEGLATKLGPIGRLLTGRTIRNPEVLGPFVTWETGIETGLIRSSQIVNEWMHVWRGVTKKGLPPYIGPEVKDAAGRRVINTLGHIVDSPELYKLTAGQKSALSILDDALRADISLTRAMGVSVEELVDNYFPHIARIKGRPIGIAAVRPTKVKEFFTRERKMGDLLEFARANRQAELLTDKGALVVRFQAGHRARANRMLEDRIGRLAETAKRDPQLADELKAVYDHMQGKQTLKTVESALEGIREAVLTLDLSGAIGIQGRFLATANPTLLARYATKVVGYAVNPESFNRWLLANGDDIAQMVLKGNLRLGVSPVDIRAGRLALEAIPLLGKAARWMNEYQFGRLVTWMKVESFRLHFETLRKMRDYEGVYRLFSKVPGVGRVVKSVGGVTGKSDDQLFAAVGRVVNNRFGGVSRAAMGRSRERAFVEQCFDIAPGFLRARAGLYANALKLGTPEGFLAQQMLLREFGLSAVASVGLSLAITGEMPNLKDPRRWDWLGVKTPVGTIPMLPSISVGRLMLRLAGGRGDIGTLGEEVEERVQALRSFLRARESPVVGLVVDQLTGTDWLGRSLDTNEQRLMEAAEAVMPIPAQEAMEIAEESLWERDVSLGEAGVRLGVQALGAGLVPKTAYQRIEERVRELTGRALDDLDALERRKLFRTDPELEELRAEQLTEQKRRGSGYAQRSQTMQELLERHKAAILEALRTDPSGRTAAQMIKDTKGDRAKAWDLLTRQLGIEDKEPKEPGLLRDYFAEKYLSVEPDADASGYVTPEEWDRYDKERQAVLTEAKAAGVDTAYIMERATTFWDDPELDFLEKLYQNAKESMREYSKIPRFIGVSSQLAERASAILRQAQAMAATQGIPLQHAIAIVGQGDPEAALVAGMESRLGNPARSIFWKQHPVLEIFWGYGAPAYLKS